MNLVWPYTEMGWKWLVTDHWFELYKRLLQVILITAHRSVFIITSLTSYTVLQSLIWHLASDTGMDVVLCNGMHYASWSLILVKNHKSDTVLAIPFLVQNFQCFYIILVTGRSALFIKPYIHIAKCRLSFIFTHAHTLQ